MLQFGRKRGEQFEDDNGNFKARQTNKSMRASWNVVSINTNTNEQVKMKLVATTCCL